MDDIGDGSEGLKEKQNLRKRKSEKMEDRKDQLLNKGDYHVERWRLRGEVPVMIWTKGDSKKKPAIIFHHGYGASKEQFTWWAATLADAGFLIALPDAYHHGECWDPNFQASNQENYPRECLVDVTATAERDRLVINLLKQREDVKKESIGIAGASMGGFISLAAIPLHKEIKAAMVVAGAAEWETFFRETNLFDLSGWKKDLRNQIDKKVQELLEKYEPIRHLNKYPPTSILFFHGAEDKMVPINCVEKFYEKIKSLYPPEKIRFKKLSGFDHSNILLYEHLIPETIDWFRKFLAS